VVVAFLACRFKRLAFAALAGCVSSLASMLNSTSTILQWISTNNTLINADDKNNCKLGVFLGPLALII
jgi:hypothetical protein